MQSFSNKEIIEQSIQILKHDNSEHDLTWTKYFSKNNGNIHANNNLFVCRFFVITNENLNYLEDLCNFECKDVLVPTASGDHSLNALYLGAKSVETFDINPLAQYMHDLKECAAKQLDYKDFVLFFANDNLDTSLNKDTYDKIKSGLQEDTRSFFDAMYQANNNRPLYDTNIIQNKFVSMHSNEKRFQQLNPYLKDSVSFYKLRDRLNNLAQPISHTLCPAHNLRDSFEEKDILILSNILNGYDLYDQENFYKILGDIPTILKDNGVTSLCYDFVNCSNPSIMTYYENHEPHCKFFIENKEVPSNINGDNEPQHVCYFIKQSEID